MTNTELFDLWRARAVEDPDLLTELDGIRGDADAINDRFYRDLAFGTGGLRGVIGAGSNRMNIYTIRRASPPTCTPGWSLPRRCPGLCVIWAAARASA